MGKNWFLKCVTCKCRKYDIVCILFSEDGKKWVEKRCALENCAVPSPEGEGPSFGVFCDTTAESYDCAFCCSESGCNGQAGAGSLSLVFLLRLLPLLTPLLAIQPNLMPFLCLF